MWKGGNEYQLSASKNSPAHSPAKNCSHNAAVPHRSEVLRLQGHFRPRNAIRRHPVRTLPTGSQPVSISFSNHFGSHSMPPASARFLQNCSPVVPATRNTTPRAQLASATATMERTASSRRVALESSTGALAMSARHGSMKTAFQKRFLFPFKNWS